MSFPCIWPLVSRNTSWISTEGWTVRSSPGAQRDELVIASDSVPKDTRKLVSFVPLSRLPAALPLPFLKWSEGENKMEKIVGWAKDQELTYKSQLQAEKTRLGENWFTLLPVKIDLDEEKRLKLKHLPPIPPTFSQAQLESFIPKSVSPGTAQGAGKTRVVVSSHQLPSTSFPPCACSLLQCGPFPGAAVLCELL